MLLHINKPHCHDQTLPIKKHTYKCSYVVYSTVDVTNIHKNIKLVDVLLSALSKINHC